MVATVAAIMVSMSCTIEGRESALAGESCGFRVRMFWGRRRAIRGGSGGESLSSRSEEICGTRLGGFFPPVRHGGGGAKLLSEVGCRVARLNVPRLEGFPRYRGRKWSLEEAERLAL